MILFGNALNKLKELEDNSIDLLCTDPPYGYSFMGKDWDKALPDIEIFKECLRVMKPGAFGFVMAAPRQDVLSRMMILLEDAGFNIDFSSIYWTYATGFPKANNIGKAIDKKLGREREIVGNRKANDIRGGHLHANYYQRYDIEITAPASDEAKAFEGSYGGFQPKPAVEVIIVIQKPGTESTQAGQALDNGKGITWLDDCRIPYADESDSKGQSGGVYSGGVHPGNVTNLVGCKRLNKEDFKQPQGRFPANLLVSDDVLDDGKEHKSSPMKASDDFKPRPGFLDGFSKHGATVGDSGNFSRFFSLDAWAERNLPFLIVPKASKKEKNAGCEKLEAKETERTNICYKCTKCNKYMISAKPENRCECDEPDYIRPKHTNNHPTVKPIKLMSYLITMGSRKGDVVLDPFCGSGTTGCACELLDRNYILIEMTEEYIPIIEARLKHWKDNKPQPSLFEL